MRQLLIACFLIGACFNARGDSSAILGEWQQNGRALEGLGPVLVTDETVSISTCKGARYSVTSDEMTSENLFFSGKVRVLTLRLTGKGCSPDFNYVQFQIPLEVDTGSQMAIALFPFWKDGALRFGAFGTLRRERSL